MDETTNFQKEFEEHLKKQQSKFETEYNKSVDDLHNFFINYSIKDILDSLFVNSLWLKNISAQVKMQLAYFVFASFNENEYCTDNKINCYKDFRNFSDELIKILPDFPMFEDYVPESDWGEIRYYHNKKLFKMFYGNNFDGIYEYLEAFQILHCTFDKTYSEITKRSPIEELEQVLTVQQSIIDSIKNNYAISEPLDINPGHIEIPEELFWESCLSFYQHQKQQTIHAALQDNFKVRIGEITHDKLELNTFLNDFHEEKNFRFMFIEYNGTFYPILPRRSLSLLVQAWGDIYQSNKSEILRKKPLHNLIMNQALSSYIKKRLPEKEIFELVSPFDKSKNKPSDSIYTCSINMNNDQFLIYLIKPSYDENEIESNLQEFESILHQDMQILEQEPLTLLLRKEERDNVVAFVPRNDKISKLTPRFIILIPRVSFSLGTFNIPEKLYGSVFLLEDFLGVIDEIEDFDEFTNFLEFMYDDKNGRHPLNTALDMYGAFKDSHGILIPGASEPTTISLWPGWGSNYRYEKLKEFWSKYPSNNLFSHPRSYEIKDMGRDLIRLLSRNIKMSMLHVKVNKTDIFINAPFTKMDSDHDRVSDLLMQIIQDWFLTYKEELSKFKLFQEHDLLHVFIFPHKITCEDDEMVHLRHLDPGQNSYEMDWGYPKENVPALRIGFNYDKVFEEMKQTQSRSFEAEFICSVIEKMSEICNDEYHELIQLMEKDSIKLPRFRINVFDKLAAFPEHERAILPETADFKVAKKIIAQIAHNNDIKAGTYSVDKANVILNRLKALIVNYINKEVNNLSFENSIGYLITKSDALNHKYEFKKLTYLESLKHEVDYIREEKYAENHSEYIKEHRNYRYLIEKMVQLSPKGSDLLKEEGLRELLALIDWMHVIQTASDMIHYSITPASLTVNDDFQVEVNYEKDFDSMEKVFGEEEALFDLETKGNPKDRADSTKDITVFLDELDAAFKIDLGFGLKNLNSVIDVLKMWPGFCGSVKESGYYKADINKLFEVCETAIISEKISRVEFINIIDFLTISSGSMLYTIGISEPSPDLPIWEHNKRPMRYNLKPLIKIKDEYIWGAYSVRKTQEIWIGNASSAMFPYEIQTENIRKLLDSERENISKGLNIKATEIVNRYTPYVRENFEIHKIDKMHSFPLDLGDYDVLAFLESKNIILNIECKDLEPPFCLKDAKRLRERFFGRSTDNRGYFEKVIRREDFLKDKHKDLLNTLKWPLVSSVPIKIISIFLMRRNYWWTKFPPFDTDVIFLRVDMLDEFLRGLKSN